MLGANNKGCEVLITDQKKVWWTHGNNSRRRSTILLKSFKMDYEEGFHKECLAWVHERHETFRGRMLGPFGMTTHRPLRRIRHGVVGRRKHWPFKRRKSCHGNLRAACNHYSPANNQSFNLNKMDGKYGASLMMDPWVKHHFPHANLLLEDLSNTPDNHLAMLAIIQTLIGGLDVERDQGCLNDDLESRARIDGSRTLLKSLEASHPYYKYKLVKYDGVELLDDKPVMDGLLGLDSAY
ncbi:hypothetical protein Tco_0718631 [Tanacetum coccineum]